MGERLPYNPITVSYDEIEKDKLAVVEDTFNDRPVLTYDGHQPITLSFLTKTRKQPIFTCYGIKKKYKYDPSARSFTSEWDGGWSGSLKLRENGNYTSKDTDDGAMICNLLEYINELQHKYYTDKEIEHTMKSPLDFSKVLPPDDGSKKKKKRVEKVIDKNKPVYLSFDAAYTIKPGHRKDENGRIPIKSRMLNVKALKKSKNGLTQVKTSELVVNEGFKTFNYIPAFSLYFAEGPSQNHCRIKVKLIEVIFTVSKFKQESAFKDADMFRIADMPDDEEDDDEEKKEDDEEDNDVNMSSDEDVMVEDETPKPKPKTKNKSKTKTKAKHDNSDIELSDDEE